MFYDIVTLSVNFIKIIIRQCILTVPEIMKFFHNLFCYLTIFCRNQFRIPLLINRQRCTCHIRTSDNDSINLFFLENISLRVETISGSFHVIHFQRNIFQSIEFLKCSRLAEIQIICRKNLSFNALFLKLF